VTWTLPKAKAMRLFKAWQQWAPAASNAITSIMKVGSRSDGKLSLRCIGQSTGSESALRHELDGLLALAQPSAPLNIESLTFFAAVDHFSGGWAYETNYFKAKSDYVVNGLSDSGIQALLEALKGAPAGQIVRFAMHMAGRSQTYRAARRPSRTAIRRLSAFNIFPVGPGRLIPHSA
jgi:hypothetical protein